MCEWSHSTKSFPTAGIAKKVGILRLRRRFAPLTSRCAQHDINQMAYSGLARRFHQAACAREHSIHYNIHMSDSLIIAGRSFRSRLIVGTGKYKSFQETARALEASGADMVTVAVRRVNLDRSKESLLDYIDPKKYFLLPNTAGCYTAAETIRTARLGREVGLSDWVKLEVLGAKSTLFPASRATVEATRVLVKEGFTVLPYTSDDIVSAKRLIDAGASAVMPLGAPIGSGLGIQNLPSMRILRELITEVPLIVDAGVGP